MVEKGEIQVGSDCDVAEAVGNFFSKSCVPGALDRKYNPTGRNPVNLCTLCGGIKQCQRDHANRYYGYDGSFRCLVETNADVAFMKHLTVPANTDRENIKSWAVNLKSSDFELLCLDGSRKSVDKWRECNLAQVPAHAILTGSHVPQSTRKYYFRVFQKAQEYFSNETEGKFSLFTSMNLGTNLMFKDYTTKLSFVAESMQHYEKYLGKEYVDAMDGIDLHKCQNSSAMRTGYNLFMGFWLIPLFQFVEWHSPM